MLPYVLPTVFLQEWNYLRIMDVRWVNTGSISNFWLVSLAAYSFEFFLASQPFLQPPGMEISPKISIKIKSIVTIMGLLMT
jgi:hypothetical protein